MASQGPESGTPRLAVPTPDSPADVDLAAVVNQLADAVIVSDTEMRILFTNAAADKLLGYAPGELTGKPLPTIVPERLRGAHVAGFRRFVTGGAHRWVGGPALRVPALCRDGSETTVDLTLNAVGDPARGRLVVGSLRDVGDRVELERQLDAVKYLRASVEVTTRLQEAVDVDAAYAAVLPGLCSGLDWDIAALWHFDADAALLRCVDVWGDDIGTSSFKETTRRRVFRPGEGLPGRCLSLGAPLVIDAMDPNGFPRWQEAEASGLVVGLAFPLTGRSGPLGVVELFSSEGRRTDEELLETLASIGAQLGQFLERMQAESELRYRAALLTSQMEAAAEGVLVVSPSRKVLAYNRRFLEMWGLSADQVFVGGPSPALLAPSLEQVKDPVAFEEGIRWGHDHPLETQRLAVELTDGRVLDGYAAPVIDDNGTYHGRVWYLRDDTERRAAEAAVAALADTLQRSLLPPHLPDIPGISVAARYRAAGPGIDVGGDFYDLFAVDAQAWAIVIGDVCGRGAAAATVTALARYTARAAAMHTAHASGVLEVVNQALLRHEQDRPFLTAAYLQFQCHPDGRVRAELSCAGHPLPYLLKPDGTARELGEPGTLLGVVPDPVLPDVAFVLEPGDRVLLFTDGLTEARDRSGAYFGEAAMLDVLHASVGEGPDQLADRLNEAVAEFQSGQSPDDMALVVIQIG